MIGFDGRMTEPAGEFAGLTGRRRAPDRWSTGCSRWACSRTSSPYEHEVGHCDRSGDRIEPLISLQWFCEMGELARPAIEAVRRRHG